jgi:hypothetical protein
MKQPTVQKEMVGRAQMILNAEFLGLKMPVAGYRTI